MNFKSLSGPINFSFSYLSKLKKTKAFHCITLIDVSRIQTQSRTSFFAQKDLIQQRFVLRSWPVLNLKAKEPINQSPVHLVSTRMSPSQKTPVPVLWFRQASSTRVHLPVEKENNLKSCLNSDDCQILTSLSQSKDWIPSLVLYNPLSHLNEGHRINMSFECINTQNK